MRDIDGEEIRAGVEALERELELIVRRPVGAVLLGQHPHLLVKDAGIIARVTPCWRRTNALTRSERSKALTVVGTTGTRSSTGAGAARPAGTRWRRMPDIDAGSAANCGTTTSAYTLPAAAST